MSKNSIKRSTTVLFVLVVSVALIGADLVVLAQNSNSNTTDETTRGGAMTSQNGNMSGGTTTGGTTRRRRRQRRRTRRTTTTSTDTTMGDMGTATTTTTTTNTSGMGMATTGNTGGEQTDLSGTYTGTVNYPEGGLSGPATLTITGNNFTLTPEGGGSAVSGRVTAVTTRGYTGVTMMFGDATAPPPTQNPPPPPLPAVSLQARRSGTNWMLRSVPGERRQFSFAPAGTAGRGRVRRRGRRSSGMSGME